MGKLKSDTTPAGLATGPLALLKTSLTPGLETVYASRRLKEEDRAANEKRSSAHMKISPPTFFNFCASHVPLLMELARQEGEISEADARRLIRSSGSADQELPETTWKRLRELQILVPTEVDGDFYLLAEPVSRLLAYLFDEAQATTPEIIQGYIQSLDVLNKQLARAIESDDSLSVRLALDELHHVLRRIQSDVDETHRSVLNEVARYKIERRTVSVREKFRRIVHWMDRYVDPLVEIVRPDGALRATFDETEHLLLRVREHGVFAEPQAIERHVRHLRIVQRHALRLFQQCRRELQPLYASLRRASSIAEGAAIALERLQREGLDDWALRHVVPVCTLRMNHVPSDAAIGRAVRNLFEHPPEPPPVIALDAEEDAPDQLIRHQWLENLVEDLHPALPVTDLLGWMIDRYPEKGTADTVAGFTRLVFDAKFSARFTDHAAQSYETSDGVLEANPVEMT